MNIFEKIKQFLFRKNEVKALPEQTQNYSRDYRTGIVLMRKDGTTVTVTPKLDRTGNQLYEQVWSEYERRVKYIPKFLVESEELKELSTNKKAYLGTEMVIDIDPSDLQNSEFAEYIANNILNKERMEKIVTKYCNYAGLVEKRFDNEGKTTFKKWIDTSVIDNLSLNKQKRKEMINEEIVRNEQERIKNMEEEAMNKKVNYKTSHAEDLSKYEDNVR